MLFSASFHTHIYKFNRNKITPTYIDSKYSKFDMGMKNFGLEYKL